MVRRQPAFRPLLVKKYQRNQNKHQDGNIELHDGCGGRGCGVSKFPWSYGERETCLLLKVAFIDILAVQRIAKK